MKLLILCPLLLACASAGQGGSGASGDDDPAGDDGPGPDGGDMETPCNDVDNDGACQAVDMCPGADDRVDSDSDTAPDGCDQCPGADDRTDADNNSVPDCTQALTKTFTVKQVGGNYWRGWISHSVSNTSGHNPMLDNTFTGETSPGNVLNSYMVFPLSNFNPSSVVSVKLRVELQGFEQDNVSTETISVWDVTTAPDQVENTGGSVPISMDLETGTKYGDFPAAATNVGQVLEVTLNASAAAGVKARANQDFAIGMHMDTVPGYLLFSSNSEARTHELVVTYVP